MQFCIIIDFQIKKIQVIYLLLVIEMLILVVKLKANYQKILVKTK